MTATAYDANATECRDINPDGTPDKTMPEKITTAIVNAMQPQRVILFGSGTRSRMRSKTDVDLLVVKDGEASPGGGLWKFHLSLAARTRSVDLVVATSRGYRRPLETSRTTSASSRCARDACSLTRQRSPEVARYWRDEAEQPLQHAEGTCPEKARGILCEPPHYAAEFATKGVIIANGRTFASTHDISRAGSACTPALFDFPERSGISDSWAKRNHQNG